jgi:Arylsulfotransferase (ASST)/Thrombospondin type 3 repeat
MRARRLVRAAVLAVLMTGAGLNPAVIGAQQQTVGLFLNEPGSFPGYTLFDPMDYTTTYLIDNEGRLVHSWDSEFSPGGTADLLDNGDLLRLGRQTETVEVDLPLTEGESVRLEEFAWDGTLVWQYEYPDDEHVIHHDMKKLPNGNVLMIAWEYKTAAEAIAAGRDPSLLLNGALYPDHIIEVEPTGASGGNIVWEWHVWDHLVQDYDPTKQNYGTVADHPELIDVNYACSFACGLGLADWLHTNSVEYNGEFDQIMVSVRHFSEIWVIDHSTTTAEAASHSGGNSGKGGDLLYRWGNPEAYRAGDAGDQKFFSQHDAKWIDPGLEGEGNILVFNNLAGLVDAGWYSSVDEFVPPVDSEGNYSLTPGQAYGPEERVWRYMAANPTDFFSGVISGAQRLPNGNTFACEGVPGIFSEVTPSGETVWRYVSPVAAQGPIYQGDSPVGNWAFRANRYAPDYPGLSGKDLTPGGPIELYHPDSDGDGVWDGIDNCPFVPNADQTNTPLGPIDNGPDIIGNDITNPYEDAVGDACDDDADNDGLPDTQESDSACPFRLIRDSDGDGSLDGYEVTQSSNPCDPASKPPLGSSNDSDGDGFTDDVEARGWGTDPFTSDSDGDACPDDKEIVSINGDKQANLFDVMWVAKMAFGLTPPHAALDLDKNGAVNLLDALLAAKNSDLVEPAFVCP